MRDIIKEKVERFLRKLWVHESFRTLRGLSALVVNNLLLKPLSNLYLSRYNSDSLEYQCQHTDTISLLSIPNQRA